MNFRFEISNEYISRNCLVSRHDKEYAEAMWLILQDEHADDFIFSTGETNSLKDFVEQCFSNFGLDWAEHVQHDAQLMRPNEIVWSQGNPEKAHRILGWQAQNRMRDVVKILCDAQRKTV